MNLITKQAAELRLGVDAEQIDAILQGALLQGLAPSSELGSDIKTWPGYPEGYLALIQEAIESRLDQRTPEVPAAYATQTRAIQKAVEQVDRHFAILRGAKRGAEKFRLEVEAERSVYQEGMNGYSKQVGVEVQRVKEEARLLALQKADIQTATQQQLADECARKTSSALVLHDSYRGAAKRMDYQLAAREYCRVAVGGFLSAAVITACSSLGLVPQLKSINLPTNFVVFPLVGLGATFVKRNWDKLSSRPETNFNPSTVTEAIVQNVQTMPPGTYESLVAMELLNKVLPSAPQQVMATPIVAAPLVTPPPRPEPTPIPSNPPAPFSAPLAVPEPEPTVLPGKHIVDPMEAWN